MTEYLRVEALGKRFSAHGRYAFEGMSFTVDQSDFVALIGPSGCGKSTLLHVAAGLSAPTSGSVLLKGQPVTKPRPDMMFVFQQYTKSIFPWKTVLDNVMLGIKYRSREPRAALEAINASNLSLSGLEQYVEILRVGSSGSMRRRVAWHRRWRNGPNSC